MSDTEDGPDAEVFNLGVYRAAKDEGLTKIMDATREPDLDEEYLPLVAHPSLGDLMIAAAEMENADTEAEFQVAFAQLGRAAQAILRRV